MKRITLLATLLLILAVAPLEGATPSGSDSGLKATEPIVEGHPSVPASNQWSMMLMVMLALAASSMALLGGGGFDFGFGRRDQAHESGGGSISRSGVEVEPAAPVEEAVTAARETKSPLHRGKPKLEPERRQIGRRSWNVSKRQGTFGRPGGGRRNGPGCRGVR